MTQETKFLTLAQNALRPGFLSVMVEKAWRRLAEPRRQREARDAAAWCTAHAQSIETFASKLAPDLWSEAVAFNRALAERARPTLAAINLDLGGGADCRLLYFLVRRLKPATVVETGVASGYSSASVLSALRSNGSGRLFSSDFPYFRLERPEQFVGVLVDPAMRDGWTLLLKGDRQNLPQITRQVSRIDLLHYDSDKSRAGRTMAMKILAPKITSDTIVVMDDIQDNLFFRDYVAAQGRPWRVFSSGSKFVGLVGL